MSINRNLLDQLLKGPEAGNLFGKDSVLIELIKALAERFLSAELDEHFTEERAEPPADGTSQVPSRRDEANVRPRPRR